MSFINNKGGGKGGEEGKPQGQPSSFAADQKRPASDKSLLAKAGKSMKTSLQLLDDAKAASEGIQDFSGTHNINQMQTTSAVQRELKKQKENQKDRLQAKKLAAVAAAEAAVAAAEKEYEEEMEACDKSFEVLEEQTKQLHLGQVGFQKTLEAEASFGKEFNAKTDLLKEECQEVIDLTGDDDKGDGDDKGDEGGSPVLLNAREILNLLCAGKVTAPMLCTVGLMEEGGPSASLIALIVAVNEGNKVVLECPGFEFLLEMLCQVLSKAKEDSGMEAFLRQTRVLDRWRAAVKKASRDPASILGFFGEVLYKFETQGDAIQYFGEIVARDRSFYLRE